MLVYLDETYERWKREGRLVSIADLSGIVIEGAVDRVRPKLMTVATMSKVADVNVVFCSMAKGSWLQKEKVIANPYYGSKMLRCGEIISGKDKGTKGGQMKGHEH